MIPFERAPEPADFDAKVRKPGQQWLAREQQGRAPDHWKHAAQDLRTAFKALCGYTAMWLSTPGTVDHFVSRDEDRSLAYEWTNFRYAAAGINSSKGALRSDQVLDPFEVGDGWFEVILPSCMMIVTERCPPEFKARAHTMLKRLKLGNGEVIVGIRLEWVEMYRKGMPLELLAEKAPLLAHAIRKQRGERERTDPTPSATAPRSVATSTGSPDR